MKPPTPFWVAKVGHATGSTVHHEVRAGGAFVVPTPASLRIVRDTTGYLLLRLNQAGDCLADTWHHTAEEAKAQAAFEYDVGSEEWVECTD